MTRAILVSKGADGVTASVTDVPDTELGEGDVVVDVEYSGVNFKDGLAVTGRPGVIRSYPLIPGIDLVGTVASSESPQWQPGDRVLVNGWGIGESRHGGLAERARVKGDWLVRVPEALSAQQAAAIGTAGFTAMLSVLALEDADATGGDVLVTGASGGVGSIAVALLAKLGHRVVASTGRTEEEPYLRRLGAAEVIDRGTLSEPGKPMQSQRWSGAVDSVGGHTLANVLAQTTYGGTVAACGLAQSAELPASVLPFILRAVTLVGINSVENPAASRQRAWDRLAADLDLGLLEEMTTVVPLGEVVGVGERILQGQVRGRTVVDVRA
ncbi:acrylyl-CoA reductase (NADPH) [Herbiconiux sp. SYSU D00978]|uniref:acrylyl-CoA reductase (NADPH) n=1 Tax=Herbiconiux sp. SYSU D00978 TaxID=2812562 RepID=UPI001A963153|nr:MDR family oxidoreductase [Herbiconiux sp. SYSU D00978]